VVRPLEQRMTLNETRVLVLGAGGAARAAAFGLKERGAHIFILNRSAASAQKLARQAKGRVIKRADLKKMDFDVIINATPVGMGNTSESPLHSDEIKARIVFDMVYDPAETRLLQLAKERGTEVIPGSEMFVHQAARQFEIWTGKPAPREDMLRIVNTALAERAAARNGTRPRRA
jgi:3-dehydroquinate dehydratase/shikimate dehydrogenase